MVLLNKTSGRYFRLNRSGARIVTDLLDGHELTEVISRGETKNPGDLPRASADIERLVGELRQSGLLVEK